MSLPQALHGYNTLDLDNYMRFFFFMLLIWSSSCSSQSLPTQVVKYTGNFPEDSKKLKRNYFIDVPKGGKLLKGDALITGDYHTEYRLTYPDSSIIYITNNEWRGSSLNFVNLSEVGITGYTKEHLLDTLDNSGKQRDGKYWREHVVGQVVVGYINVPPDKKSEYDKALATLRRKK